MYLQPPIQCRVTEYLRRVHQVLSCICTCTCTSSYLTLPNLQSSYIPYLPTVCRNHLSRESFIHSHTSSLPPSRLPAWYICLYLYLCVYASVYLRVCPRICPCACTYIHTYNTLANPQKIHIKDTYQRYMYTCVLGYVVVSYFKNNICRSDRHKKPPDERPCTRPVFHNFTR